MATSDSRATIEIQVEKISQLFDALDPFPYPHRDLAQTTEEFIVGWARELPKRRSIEIVVHLPADQSGGQAAQQLGDAFSNHFRYCVDRLSLKLRELFRIGRWSSLIGMAVLAGCILLGQHLADHFEGYFNRFFNESLIILGWVANWRPIEIFLYDWWPVVRQRNLYRRLSTATLQVKSHSLKEATIIRPKSDSLHH